MALIWNKKFKVENCPFVKSDDGVMNAVVKVDGERSRNRVSCIVMKGTKVYLAKDEDGKFTLPGGGVEQSRTPMEQAEQEVHEETKMKIKNIRETSIQFLESHKDVKQWVKEHVPEKDWWTGYFTTVFIAEYDGEFNGKIKDRDLDPQIKNTGKFYEFEDVKNKSDFLEPWKKAIENHLNNILSEAHRDDPEVVELATTIKKSVDRLDELGINTKNLINEDELGTMLLKEDIVDACDALLNEIITEANGIQKAEFGDQSSNDSLKLAEKNQTIARYNAKVADAKKTIINNSPVPQSPKVIKQARREDAVAKLKKANANNTVNTLKSIQQNSIDYAEKYSLDDIISESENIELFEDADTVIAKTQLDQKTKQIERLRDAKQDQAEKFDNQIQNIQDQKKKISQTIKAETRNKQLENSEGDSNLNEGAKNFDLKNNTKYKAPGYDKAWDSNITIQHSKEYNEHDISLQFNLKNRVFAGKSGQVLEYLIKGNEVELDPELKYIADRIKDKTDTKVVIRKANIALAGRPPKIEDLMKCKRDIMQIYNYEASSHNKDNDAINKLFGRK